ncbi:MAG: DNA primase [Clostridiales bacterium]|jgi:putative DNA primase/helicase|nr:DNA primase [Clostridiales bacterium]
MSDWEKTGFYKAFLHSKGKKPIAEYTKTTDNHCSFAEVQPSKEYVAMLGDDAVLFDADDELQSENLLKLIQGENLACLVTERKDSKSKGIHVLMFDAGGVVRQNHTKVMLACGIVVDIKLGRKNGLECLKFEGTERSIVYDGAPYQSLPLYFKPISRMVDFAQMQDGDGRNPALFSYILTLQDEGFTVEQVRETISIINKYVLKDPISERELDVILRDEAFRKGSFFKSKTLQHDKFAEFLRDNNHIIKVNGQLHIYRGGVYKADPIEIKREMIKHIPELRDAQIKEVWNRLQLICENKPLSAFQYIAFKNGIYDLNTDELKDFSPEIVITNPIPWDYNPAAESELLEQTLDKIACYDPEIRALLEEVAGSCLYRSNTLAGGRAFILTGDGANGKSTFIDMIKTMLGEDNITSLDLKELGEKFQNAELFGKLANLGDDIGSEFVANANTFRKLVTGERIQVQRKGQDPFEFNNYAKMIFSANDIPRLGRIKEHSAIIRRLLIVPFNAKFSNTDADFRPGIKYELQSQEAVERLILLAIRGLKAVIERKDYTKSEKTEKAIEEYAVESNPLLGFIEDCRESGYSMVNQETEDVYQRYCRFCDDGGFKEISKIVFSRQINKLMGLKSKVVKVLGKTTKIYVQDDSYG